MTARRALLAVLGGAAACAQLDASSGPRPLAVVPSGAYRGQELKVRVSGTGYEVRGVQRLSGGGEVSAQFEVRIGGVALTGVHYLGDAGEPGVVEAIVPADLPVGIHDVEVRDSYGRVGILTGGFTESDHAPPSLSAALTVPANVEVGVVFVAAVEIANAGGTDARIAALDIDGADGGAAGVLVPAGARVDLEVPATVALRGPATPGLHVTALDEVTGLPLDPLEASASLMALMPPSLAVSLGPTPASVDIGQAFTVPLTVTNGGDVGALAVTPGILQNPALSAGSAVPQDIPAGTSRTLAVVLQGAAASLADFDAVASGVDQLTGAPVSSTPIRSPPITIVNGASLSAGAPSFPATLSRGQTFAVSVTILNSGQARALAVQASLSAMRSGGADWTILAAPGPRDIAGGGSETFVWSCAESGTAPGALSLTATASGTDANSGAAVSTTSPSATATVQAPAALSVAVQTPSAIDRGQSFTVLAVVTNAGGAIARRVQVSALTENNGGAAASITNVPPASDIGPGATVTFPFGYVENGGASGTITFQASATGTDANSGAPVSASGTSSAMPVLKPASLSISSFVLAPGSISRGQSFTAQVTVRNNGEAGAASVTAALSQTASGGAHASTSSSPGFVGLAGGASATFTWTFTEDGVSPGSIAFTATGSGIDANSQAPLSTPPSQATVLVQPPESAQIANDPFAGDGTNFAYLFSYQGMVYAGPNQSGSGAVRMAPDGSGATAINWQLEVDTSAANPARNLAYQPPNPPICHTIGTPGCVSGTTACGPDNESGRAIFASGTVAGTEWYLLTGPSSAGGSRYAYLTNPGFPLASGGYDDLAFVQIEGGQFGSAHMITAAYFFQDKVYLGFLGTQQDAPVLNALSRMPALPGYVAAAGTDLVDLQGVKLPAIGAQGSPGNKSTTWAMIDAISDLNGSLYVANNGGIARSVGAPAPCNGTGCATWANATPSTGAWTGKTSVTVDGSVLGSLQPAQRAVPAMVPFGGQLFAARNTTTGPQLWSCKPSSGSDPLQCDPGDWTLVAPNSSGDTLLTQFNSSSNSAITLLVATSSHLFVGFNSAGGIQIFRTALPTARARADFTGQAGCDASQPTCAGIGGAGLGAGLTRIFDARAFSLGGAEWLYLAAGDGTAGPKVYRLAP
jgi:hypothetical protein